ncbi:MAG TPA: META domain-containing protein [Actinomycetota bacterium]|nr:META domain-containing protein [Actinomycetota bacterium]
MSAIRSLIPLALLLSLVACGEEARPTGNGDLEDVTWILDRASIDALVEGAPEETRATIRFERGEVGGVAACNQYGGTYEADDGGAIAISVGSMTEMACAEPLMTLESAFVDALGRVSSYRFEGEDLVLEGGGPALRFSAERALPLEGTAWRLDGIGSGGDTVSSILAGTEVNATFDDTGRVGGFGGCNHYGGAYETDGEVLTISDVASTQIGCAADVAEQEGAFLEALGRTASFEVQGSVLTLLDDDGGFLLSFVAELAERSFGGFATRSSA